MDHNLLRFKISFSKILKIQRTQASKLIETQVPGNFNLIFDSWIACKLFE
jgi:hypothetical protein